MYNNSCLHQHYKKTMHIDIDKIIGGKINGAFSQPVPYIYKEYCTKSILSVHSLLFNFNTKQHRYRFITDL